MKIYTEVLNFGKEKSEARLTSTVLDGKAESFVEILTRGRETVNTLYGEREVDVIQKFTVGGESVPELIVSLKELQDTLKYFELKLNDSLDPSCSFNQRIATA